MSDQPVRFTPLGNLDKDSEYKLVGKGNYIDALDIIKQDDDNNVSGTIQPTKRNKHAFSLGSVQAQNKKYRVTVDGDSTKKHRLKFLSTKKDVSITQASQSDGSIWFEGTVGSLLYFFNQSSLPGAFQVTVSGNTVEFELVAYNYYQWYLDSVGDDSVLIECLQEAIPTDLAGPLKDIGSYDLLGKLYIHSTTQDNEPTELEAKIIDIGPESPYPFPPPPFVYSGPLTSLTFNAEHGLQEGQWIRIKESNGGWLNGRFVVNSVISPTVIEIVTDTAWGAAHLPHTIGQERVFTHPTGIGEIGVAQKNNTSETWTYTRLLRSWELNYVSKHDIEIDARNKAERDIQYFTDNYNGIRSLSYKGGIEIDGAINYVNEQNIYAYDNISTQISINAPVLSGDLAISLVSVNAAGGSLSVGNKYYSVRFLDPFDSPTKWSDPFGPISIYPKDHTHDDPIELKGGESGASTSKSVTLNINGIPQNLYRTIEVCVITNTSGSVSSDIFYSEVIPSGATFLDVTHSGNETNVIPLDIGEYIASFSFNEIWKAETLSIIDKRLTLGNLTYKEDLLVSDFASKITHKLEYTEIDGVGGDPPFKEYGGELDPFNIEATPTLILNETYRVGIELLFKTNVTSKVYWVDDIVIDTESTNLANPSDNRRLPNGGLPNYALNREHNFKTKVPNIVFSNVDLDSFVDGYQLRNLISSVRFRFAPVVKEVLSSGFAVLGVSGSRRNIAEVDYGEETQYGWLINIFLPGLGFIFNPTVQGDITTDFSVMASSYTDIGNDKANIIPYPDWNDEWTFEGHPQLSVAPIVEVPDGIGTYPGRWERGDWYPGGARHPGIHRDYAAFYSTDVSQGEMDGIELLPGDELLIYYPLMRYKPKVINTDTEIQGYNLSPGNEDPLRGTPSSKVSLIAHPTHTGNPVNTDLQKSSFVRRIKIKEGAIFNPGDDGELGGERFANHFSEGVGGGALRGRFRNNNDDEQNDALTTQWLATEKCIGLSLEEDAYPADGIPGSGSSSGTTYWGDNGADSAVYYAQVFRANNNKYGNISETVYTSHTESFNTEDIVDVGTELRVFGGDAFICSSLMRWRAWSPTNLDRDYMVGFDPIGLSKRGRYQGLRFISQSYMNMDLVHKDPNEVERSFPEDYSGSGIIEKYNNWVQDLSPDEIAGSVNEITQNFYVQFYNPEYSYNWGFLTHAAYDEYYDAITKLPARIAYSSRDVYSAILDNMRVFPPFNIHDLDTTFGEINKVYNINGELFTLQSRKYQLQYFNTRGTLQGSNQGVEVLIGDGSVLSRDGQTLSSYGTDHKWSVVKGSSPGGKDVIYWFNQENGLFMRFGADGTVVLSERHGLRSFSANNTRWTKDQYTPALNYGIRSVWDDRFKEAIWTFIGIRENRGDWGVGNKYGEGDIVIGGTFDNYSFDGIPDVYISISPTHTSSLQTEPGVGGVWEAYWKLADKDDPEYYSVFTIAFNELSNGFSTFYSHIPKTYLKWKNKFLSSHPTERSEIYEHRYGYDKWYEHDGVWKESEPYLEGVVNPFPDQSKKFVAIQALTDNVPDRIELKTKDHESFLVATDFDPEDDAWRTPIKNDILTSQTGDPNDDTVSLIGSYMRVKFKFFNGAYNKMNNLVVKVRQRLRRTQS